MPQEPFEVEPELLRLPSKRQGRFLKIYVIGVLLSVQERYYGFLAILMNLQ